MEKVRGKSEEVRVKSEEVRGSDFTSCLSPFTPSHLPLTSSPLPFFSVYSVEDFHIPVELHPDLWNRDIASGCGVTTRQLAVVPPKMMIVSLQVPSRVRVEVRSFFFAQHKEQILPGDQSNESDSAGSQKKNQVGAKETPKQFTRICVPRDTIKLKDRLNFLLQPPLENILGQPTLEVPHEPYPYQLSGISFLYGSHRAILADEMGLGKTMQAITTIRLLLRTGELQNVLLVCPKPLVTNWQREFSQWAPEIHIQVIEGHPERRKWLWQLDKVPVRIANYELLNRDLEYYDLPRSRGGPHFDLVILDESQRIKNRNSATSHSVRSLSRSRSWALTGTPVENSPDDLVGIFEFLSPGYLSPGMKPVTMSEMVGDYILRRTKDKVLTDLPPIMTRDAHLALSPAQRHAYHQAEQDGTLRLNDMGDSLTIQNVFELVLRLKQICNFEPATGESTKLERLLADLEEVATSGHKAIIFSQWVETFDKLREHLTDYRPVEYHGKIPMKQRDNVIKTFREDKNCHVILMSYGAGSVGLNLQFANYVFLFDRWWNPAVEDQAINRAHRIGVTGPVTVTRFLIADTIEERIDNILQSKRELFEEIMSGARGLNYSTGMSQEEIFGLFNLKTPRHKAA